MHPPRSLPGFTLLELVATIAITAVLASIVLPTAGAAHRSAAVSRTRLQWAVWVSGIEAFRLEYGVLPQWHASDKVNGGAGPLPGDDHQFHDTLAGKRRDGSAPAPGGPGGQNARRLRFVEFSDADFSGSLIASPVGATDIAVLVDRNGDGVIDPVDYPLFPAVSPPGAPAVSLRPGDAQIGAGIRASAAFYCAPAGAVHPSELVLSWK